MTHAADKVLIKYYDDGWRYGWLEARESYKVLIKPVGAYNSNERSRWFQVNDTEAVTP